MVPDVGSVAFGFGYPLISCFPAVLISVSPKWIRCSWLVVSGLRFLFSFEDESFVGFVLLVVSPVRLEEDGVDLLGVDDLGLVPDGFDEGSDAEVLGGA